MRTKNHIKAKNNSLRGIGKLGWSEEGSLHSTIKRLVSTFNSNSHMPSTGAKKHKVICPTCKRKFYVNNPNRIPLHDPSYFSHRYSNGDSNACKGAWSKQLSDKKQTLLKSETNSALGLIKVGDRFLIDFSRTILQEYDSVHKDIFESTLVKIAQINSLANDDSLHSCHEILYFSEVEKPIVNHIGILKHMIKIN